MKKTYQSGLGKGLSALIPKKEDINLKSDQIHHLEIEQIKVSRYQPREDFNPERLRELVDSIREQGVIEPIIVVKKEDGYHLICGERRLRACKTLGWKTIPAIVKKDVSDKEILQISLIENLQREDLNVIEQAKGLKRLIEEFNLSHQEVGRLIGKDRSSVTHLLRVLNLPGEIQEELKKARISFGHAKVLLEIEDKDSQKDICQRVIRYNLSVRETERLVKKALRFRPSTRVKKKKEEEEQIKEIERYLEEFLGTKVSILLSKKGGRIEIEFYSLKDLQRILELIQSDTD
ncbi:MAG: hypothetical protein DRP75_01550 [Candidatus Omnitrophota bacterium]|nr:MAG: hypothetical protein DRP75_01550 [Candidatus Omnitrophota bacterium]